MNLFFSIWRCKFWGKFRNFPNCNIFNAVNWKSHYAKFSLVIKFCRFWRGTSIWISGLAINHHIKQVNCLSLIFWFLVVFFMEVNTDSQSPVVFSFFHMNNSSNIHVREDIFGYSAEIFYFLLMVFGSFM